MIVFGIAGFIVWLVASATIEPDTRMNFPQLIGIYWGCYAPFPLIAGAFFFWMGRSLR
jgi:hypothetical protein